MCDVLVQIGILLPGVMRRCIHWIPACGDVVPVVQQSLLPQLHCSPREHTSGQGVMHLYGTYALTVFISC